MGKFTTMETKEPNNITITERDKIHEKFMISILKNLCDTPLVLKGGTALYLGYGLNRFSEDLDFDSSKKINLLNKIKLSAPSGIVIDEINLKKDTDTVTRYMIKYHDAKSKIKDSLKIEISYRTPVPEEQVVIKNGIRFSPIERIIDNKLNAAYDGSNIRTKGRDLFDLHFLASQYPESFNIRTSIRLKEFAKDPDKLLSLYYYDVKQDPLLSDIMDLEKISIEINEISEKLVALHSNKEKELTPIEHSLKPKFKP